VNERKQTVSKSALTVISGIAVSVLGFIGIFTVKSVFDGKISTFVKANGFVPVSNDNYYLFFNVSTVITAALLALTLLSAATYVFQKEKPSKFTFLTVTTSPVICAVALLMVSGFYSYLSHGSECVIFPYVLLTGIFEAALFALPFAVTRAHRITTHKTRKTKNNKKSTR